MKNKNSKAFAGGSLREAGSALRQRWLQRSAPVAGRLQSPSSSEVAVEGSPLPTTEGSKEWRRGTPISSQPAASPCLLCNATADMARAGGALGGPAEALRVLHVNEAGWFCGTRKKRGQAGRGGPRRDRRE